MTAAQTIVEGMPLLTADKTIHAPSASPYESDRVKAVMPEGRRVHGSRLYNLLLPAFAAALARYTG